MFLGLIMVVCKVLQAGRNDSATYMTYTSIVCFPLTYTVVKETTLVFSFTTMAEGLVVESFLRRQLYTFPSPPSQRVLT